MRKIFNLPPGWPEPPLGWHPGPDWVPHPDLPLPPDWQLWVEVPDTTMIGSDAVAVHAPGDAPNPARQRKARITGWVVTLVLAFFLGGALGSSGETGPGVTAQSPLPTTSATADAAPLAEAEESLEEERRSLKAARAELASDREAFEARVAATARVEARLDRRAKAIDDTESVLADLRSRLAARAEAVEDGEAALAEQEAQLAARQEAVATAEDEAVAGITGGGSGGDVHYENCDAARAAGAAPVHAGDAGYGPHLDGDGDGTGCE